MFKNKKTRKKLCNKLLVFTFLFISIFILSISIANASIRKNSQYEKINRKFAEIVIEASSGRVLSQQHADKQLYPASLTKMMTLYLTFKALDEGKLTRSKRLPISYHAAAQVPSSLRLKPGEKIKVVDAILSIVTKSANDSAVVLAEAIGKTERNFARIMNKEARKLGMSRTHFVNASGLYNRRHISTVRDMSKLAQALIKDYPNYYHYFSTGSFTYKGKTYRNHNRLMKTYDGMDGLKTGYVYASGYNLATSAVRNGTRIIGILFGGRTTRSRNKAMARYLDRGFSLTNRTRIAALNKKALVPLPMRKPDIVNNDYIDNNYSFTDSIVAQINNKSIMPQGDSSFYNDETNGIKTARKWIIQVGSFPSHSAGIKAIVSAKEKASSVAKALSLAKYNIATLETGRGTIYRARISGLDLREARSACDELQNGCLVLYKK